MSVVFGWVGLAFLMFWLAKGFEEKKSLPTNTPQTDIFYTAMQTFFFYTGVACIFGLIMGLVVEYRCADALAAGTGAACMSLAVNWVTQFVWFPALIFLFGVLFLIILVYNQWEEIRKKNY